MLRIALLLLHVLQEPAAPEADAQPLLLEVHLGPTVLAEALPVQQIGTHMLLPLGEICHLLDFAVEIDFVNGRASGFVLSEDRRFLFDAATGTAVVAGVTRVVPQNQIAQLEDDIYVGVAALARLLPVDFEIDLPGAMLQIRPRQPLPMQLRLAREQRALGTGSADLVATYPRTELPYRALAMPFMDLRAMGNMAPNPGQSRYPTQFDGSYSTLLRGDLLYLESTLQAAGTTDSPFETTRLTLGRKDPEGGLLGPLHAREVSVGEISYPGSDLIAFSMPGTGFLISNAPLNRPTEYDHHTFRGPLPPGWDVELYKNDALVGYQQSRADGRYEFNVPILFELNNFRLVFYGPEGQKREELYTFNVGQTLTPRGQVFYRLAAAAPQDKGARTMMGVDIGLARNLSATIDGGTVELRDGRHTYGKATLFGYWNRLFATGGVIGDERGGWGAQGGLQLRLDSVGLTLKRFYFDNFRSERVPETYGPVHHRTSLRINGTALAGLPVRLPIVLDANRDDLVTGGAVRSLGAQMSASYRGFALSNQLTWIEPPPAQGSSLSTGLAQFGKTNPRFSFRSEAAYELRPTRRLTSLAVVAEKPFAETYLTSLGANLDPARGQTRLLASVHKTAGKFGFGVLSNYAPGEGFAVTLSLFAGVQRDDQTREWHSAARPISGSGAASARVFLDTNDNGKFDPGERPIEGAAFTVNNGVQEAVTDGNGMAFLANMPTHQEVALGLSVGSLEDPYWMSRRPGVRFLARPGRVAPVDFPIIVAGEINGTVYWQGQAARPMSGITLELVDDTGTVTKRARSAYDGFFEISSIPPGHYRLRVASSQAAQLGVTGPERSLQFDAAGTIFDGLDVLLLPTSVAPGLAPPPVQPVASEPPKSTSTPTNITTATASAP